MSHVNAGPHILFRIRWPGSDSYYFGIMAHVRQLTLKNNLLNEAIGNKCLTPVGNAVICLRGDFEVDLVQMGPKEVVSKIMTDVLNNYRFDAFCLNNFEKAEE